MKCAVFILLMVIASSAAGNTTIPVDEALAKNALVVLRAKLISGGGNSDKYDYYEVEILRVFKNESGEILKGRIQVASYSWKLGVPKGESTLYLERYNQTVKGIWKLVGGEAATGVSHTKTMERQND
jgi:hypothetical protein